MYLLSTKGGGKHEEAYSLLYDTIPLDIAAFLPYLTMGCVCVKRGDGATLLLKGFTEVNKLTFNVYISF